MNQVDLLKINVNEHTEKKNGLTYLSWAWAWSEVLKVDPAATFKVEMYANSEGSGVVPYMDLGNSSMVWVTVTIFGKPMTCQLPILDFRNKPIPAPNAFDVNTSIMRCLAKGIALHGLGLYIYAGEDLPPDAEEPNAVMGDLMNKEDAPAYKKIADKNNISAKKRPQPTEWDNSDASRQLFADSMLKFADICTTVDDLNSYWMNNQLQLESLKETHPDLFKRVLEHFSTMKKTFTQGTANG
jgi:hypothetical protein